MKGSFTASLYRNEGYKNKTPNKRSNIKEANNAYMGKPWLIKLSCVPKETIIKNPIKPNKAVVVN